ncbi:hypothetical protein [Actinomadura rupiterrae]|uniref:hypothetical protein n=1 Tax=Actinomadura rupiterrae TaxID=559627 RepID=UPI0020A2A331|nr:hypothetical protein [Actinomadura rupiterrae]MCP2335982.1 hypothetical protein [Actinomadura rupiterrae]
MDVTDLPRLLVGFVLLVGLPLRAAFHRRIMLTQDKLVVRKSFRTYVFPLSEITSLTEVFPGAGGPRWARLSISDSTGNSRTTWNLGRDYKTIVQTIRDAVIQASGADPMAYEDEETPAR